jgi:predicted TIM-barrel fold metal-dependent hydrolase
VEFARGAGRKKVMLATNFPTVGHRQALGQLGDLDLSDGVRHDLVGANARRVFQRLGGPSSSART